jgi:hypothetical protein
LEANFNKLSITPEKAYAEMGYGRVQPERGMAPTVNGSPLPLDKPHGRVQPERGMAPTVSLEPSEYDARSMNQALKASKPQAQMLKSLLSDSDRLLDSQALILSPENVIAIAGEIVKGANYIDASLKAANKALDIIDETVRSGTACGVRNRRTLDRDVAAIAVGNTGGRKQVYSKHAAVMRRQDCLRQPILNFES